MVQEGANTNRQCQTCGRREFIGLGRPHGGFNYLERLVRQPRCVLPCCAASARAISLGSLHSGRPAASPLLCCTPRPQSPSLSEAMPQCSACNIGQGCDTLNQVRPSTGMPIAGSAPLTGRCYSMIRCIIAYRRCCHAPTTNTSGAGTCLCTHAVCGPVRPHRPHLLVYSARVPCIARCTGGWQRGGGERGCSGRAGGPWRHESDCRARARQVPGRPEPTARMVSGASSCGKEDISVACRCMRHATPTARICIYMPVLCRCSGTPRHDGVGPAGQRTSST